MNKCAKCKNFNSELCNTCFVFTKCGTVFDHTMAVLESIDSTDPVLQFAALFHDVGKTNVTRQDVDGKIRFIYHELYGAKKATQILKNMKFDNDFINDVSFLIKHHMDIHHLENVSKKGYRKFVREIPEHLIDKLFDLVDADRKGTIVRDKQTGIIGSIKSSEDQKRIVYETIEELKTVSEKPFRYLDGHQLMDLLNLKPGREVGKAISIMIDIQDEFGHDLDIDDVKKMITNRYLENIE